MGLDLSSNTAEQLQRLAIEDGITVEELVQKLAETEDRHRHVIHPPFEGEVRVQCSRELCSEQRRRPNLVGIIER